MWRYFNNSLLVKIENWLLLIFVFSIPFQTRIFIKSWTEPFNEWTAAFIWGTDVLLLLLLIFGAINKSFPKIRKHDLFILLFFLVAGLSIFKATITALSVYRFIKLAEYIAFFFYLRNVLKHENVKKQVLYAVIFSSLFQSAVAISQYLFQSNIGLKILGESVLSPYGQGVAVIEVNYKLFLRAYGTFPHPNVLAVWLILGIFSLIKIRPKWHLFALPVLLMALFFTFSRTAIAAGVFCAVVLCVFYKEYPKKIILTSMITAAFLLAIFWPQAYSRLHISPNEEAVTQRILYNKIASQDAQKKLPLGVGIGQFVVNLKNKMPLYPEYYYQPAHNIYLLIFSEIGLLGVVLFCLYFLTKAMRSPLLIIVILLSLLDHYFWTLQQGGLILWGVMGYIYSSNIAKNGK